MQPKQACLWFLLSVAIFLFTLYWAFEFHYEYQLIGKFHESHTALAFSKYRDSIATLFALCAAVTMIGFGIYWGYTLVEKYSK